MTIKARRVVATTVSMPDQVGLLAEITRLMKDDGVDLYAATVWVEDGTAHMIGVPKDIDAARKCALKNGISLKETPALRVKGDDKIGALLPVAKTLADAGINITATMAVAAGDKYAAIVMVAESDYEKACKALDI